MRRLGLGLVLSGVLAALGACKGDPVRCEKAARNYATLVYWDKADAEIAAAPEADRKLMRQRKLSEFTNKLEQDIDFFVGQCTSANNDDQVDCMIAAKTAAEARECAELAK